MTRSELYHLLNKPQDVKEEHIPALERLTEAYPYAGSFIFLYLYALAKSDDVRYSSELRRLSAFLPNRQSLYALLYGQQISPRSESSTPGGNDAFSLIEDFLEGARSAGEDLPEDLHFSASEGADYFADEEAKPTTLEASDTESEAGRIDFVGTSRSTPPVIGGTAQGLMPMGREGEDWEQELFTETLAKIYIQQGKYERALSILEGLHLHYPQKNRYFADQIRFLKRLIENNSENKDYK